MRFQADILSLQQSPQLYRLNQSTAQVANGSKPEEGKKNGNYDTATISPMGRAVNRMQSLMEQKESLNQRKHELIEKTLEKGGSLKDIQEQLECFETSMESIDEQVAGLMENALKVENKDGNSKKENQDAQQPKTEDEAQAQQLNAVTAIAGNLDTVEATMSTTTKMQGRIRTLQQEIKLDGNIRSAHGEKLATSGRKGSEIKDLEEKIESAMETIGEAMSDAGESAGSQNAASETPEQAETVLEDRNIMPDEGEQQIQVR